MAKHPLVDWIGPQPDDPKPIIYFTGVVGPLDAEPRILDRGKAKFRGISFLYLEKEERSQRAARLWKERGIRVFFDSGAFTLQRDNKFTRKDLDAFAQRYAAMIHATPKQWDFYVTLDWRLDSEVTWEAHQLCHKLGIYPSPVFHGTDTIDWFYKYVDAGYKLINISKPVGASGNTLRRFYDKVFNMAEKHNVCLHGLSQTGSMLLEYPWYSVDSTSWTMGSRTASILIIDPVRRKVAPVHFEGGNKGNAAHWNSLPPDNRKEILRQAKLWGFTEKELRTDYLMRCAYNMRALSESVAAKRHTLSGAHQWTPLL